MLFIKTALNEVWKELLVTWSYRTQWLAEMLALSLLFFYLMTMSHHIPESSHNEHFYLFSYAIWFYSVLIIGDISSKLSTEMRTGTFEQVYLSVLPITLVFLSRIFASLIRSTLLMLIFVGPLMLFLGKLPGLDQTICLLIVLTCLAPGLIGLSFLMGGITFLIKESGPLINILNNGLLFLSGAFLPLNALPHWLASIALLLPTTKAIKIITQFTTPEFPFSEIPDLLSLCVTSLVYLGVGLLAFSLCEKRAKSLGSLGHY